eukprot:TRINITY_DN15133_c0_g1_i2.p1 TRINITY_DN15133_c0_g1~~TRINITY_DN15133_c0_g1_i2.p1  ORF type:complete len:368 (-),score=66.63 TRINITY_DN15133_c0_g1_i2:440-1543(-)
MSSPSTQFASSRRIGVYGPNHQIGMWGESFKADSSQNTGSSMIVEADAKLDNISEEAPHGMLGASEDYDEEANKPGDKVLRRLAQNREAARKSRLRKKAYVQSLESSRMKLSQLEQELERARQQLQGIYIAANPGDSCHLGPSGTVNSGIAKFELDYSQWLEEQQRQICALRVALQASVSDVELHVLVESSMNHYDALFRMKEDAAKADVFYIMAGTWKTTAERFYMWIGGFRPSELLKVLTPQLDPLTEQQALAVCKLQQSSQQAEDALSQGMDKLQQTLAETLASDPLVAFGAYTFERTVTGMGNLDDLEDFVKQADNLRHVTLQQMYLILTPRQAARGLLALEGYIQSLRALSSLWAARPREPA